MQDIETSYKHCLQCNEAIALESRFCKHCGVVQRAPDPVSSEDRWITIQQAALFYAIELLLCCLASFVPSFKSIKWSLVFDALLAVNTLIFVIYRWDAIKPFLKWPNFSFQKLCAYSAIALTGSIIVHYSVTWLNETIYSKDVYYYTFFETGKYAPFLMIFFTAVMPAVFEELAFRGYLLQSLLKVADAGQAIFISAFLFSIIHLSFISLFWLIPFAWFQGFTRIKENTIWYGVFFHFFFNLGACLYQMWWLKYFF